MSARPHRKARTPSTGSRSTGPTRSFRLLNPELVDALNELFRKLERDYDTRIVVIRGAGKNFCAGLRHQGERALAIPRAATAPIRRPRSTASAASPISS